MQKLKCIIKRLNDGNLQETFFTMATKQEYIQTLHPDPAKTNKRILKSKYDDIQKNLLLILKDSSPTHSELMEAIYDRVKDHFEGGVQWYGETVKLDLEARGIIERMGTKPGRYRLKKK
ncbi:MAG: hypothetical protein JSS67_05075 [Bacteroidetes bacterium]|nr:hypothetical protein [Bacteroidota bacterium]